MKQPQQPAEGARVERQIEPGAEYEVETDWHGTDRIRGMSLRTCYAALEQTRQRLEQAEAELAFMTEQKNGYYHDRNHWRDEAERHRETLRLIEVTLNNGDDDTPGRTLAAVEELLRERRGGGT